MNKAVRKSLLKIAKKLDADYKTAYYHNQVINTDYFLSKIKKACSKSNPAKRKLSNILFDNNILKKSELIKDMEIVTGGHVLSDEAFRTMIYAETLHMPINVYPRIAATRYVKAHNDNTYNLTAKDIGNILHKLL